MISTILLADALASSPVVRCGKNICNSDGIKLNSTTLTGNQRVAEFQNSPHARKVMYAMFFPSIDEQYLWAVNIEGTGDKKISRAMTGEVEVQKWAMSPDGTLGLYAYGKTSTADDHMDITNSSTGSYVTVTPPAIKIRVDRVEWSCDSQWVKVSMRSQGADIGSFYVSRNGGVMIPVIFGAWPGAYCLFSDGFESGDVNGGWDSVR